MLFYYSSYLMKAFQLIRRFKVMVLQGWYSMERKVMILMIQPHNHTPDTFMTSIGNKSLSKPMLIIKDPNGNLRWNEISFEGWSQQRISGRWIFLLLFIIFPCIHLLVIYPIAAADRKPCPLTHHSAHSDIRQDGVFIHTWKKRKHVLHRQSTIICAEVQLTIFHPSIGSDTECIMP